MYEHVSLSRTEWPHFQESNTGLLPPPRPAACAMRLSILHTAGCNYSPIEELDELSGLVIVKSLFRHPAPMKMFVSIYFSVSLCTYNNYYK